jgi:hypothetical protein
MKKIKNTEYGSSAGTVEIRKFFFFEETKLQSLICKFQISAFLTTLSK